ncbi:hypothetical protein S4A8_12387 [Salinisphaera sp. S4-8]|uniref:DUF4209 domain-containing protein n=1 Tax=Salinisphaera sp. S4-8 TaxID=633357 RepID=UPI003341277C
MSEAKAAAEIVNAIVARARKGECIYCHGEILSKARDGATPDQLKPYLTSVGEIASYQFRQSNPTEPFDALFQSSDRRSAIPSDLGEDALERVRAILPHIRSAEIRARISDVLWLRQRRPENAKAAVASYIEAAHDGFDLEHWTFAAEAVERALRLASLFRRKQPDLCQSVANVLLAWIEEHSATDQRFLTARSISLLLQFGYGDPSDLHQRVKAIAKIAQEDSDYHRAEEYWRLAVEAARVAGDNEAANGAQVQLAESYAACARMHGKSGMIASHWMQKAVEAYKAVPSSKEMREELYQELLNFQKQSLSEMRKCEHSVDITEIVKATVEAMEGLEATDALFKLAFGVARQPNYEKLRAQARELAQKYPLSSLFGAVHLDREGKVVAKSEGGFGSGDGVSSREVYRLAAHEHQFIVIGQLAPAIDVLITDHAISEQDILSVVVGNPFVEPGQEKLYAKALWAGLSRDFIVATSLLVPLLENSLRHVLKGAGERVSTLNPSGIQEALRIGALLDHPKTEEIFGKDSIADLKGILIERTYGNLRNEVSHGLVTWNTFHQPFCIYLWWLVLRFVLMPYCENWAAQKQSDGESEI